MANLGEFGAAIKELDPNAEKDTFTYFGEKFEIAAVLPPMLMFQLAAAMTGKVPEEEGMTSMWEAYRISLGDVEFNRLYTLAVKNKGSVEDLMQLVMTIYQADAGRPTEQPADSSDGLQNTSPSSSPSSTHPAFAGLTPVSQVLAG